MKLIHYFLTVLLTAACSKSKTDEPSNIINLTREESIAKEYGINTNGIKDLTLKDFFDDTTKILLYGGKDRKLWINIGDKKTKKSILNWTDSKLLDTLLIEDLGYGDVRKSILDNTRVYPIYNNGNISFSLIRIGNDVGLGIYHRYFFKNNIYTNRVKVKDYGNGITFIPHIWFNGSVLYDDGGHQGQNLDKTQYSIYDNTGNIITKLYESSTSRDFIDDKFYPINYDQAIYLDDPYFIKWDYVTEKETWRTEKAIASQIATNLRIDTKKIARDGDILTVTCSYTLYSGEKGTFSYTVNIMTGVVTKI